MILYKSLPKKEKKINGQENRKINKRWLINVNNHLNKELWYRANKKLWNIDGELKTVTRGKTLLI